MINSSQFWQFSAIAMLVVLPMIFMAFDCTIPAPGPYSEPVPRWSPTREYIAVTHGRSIAVVRTDGSEVLLLSDEPSPPGQSGYSNDIMPAFSPDGSKIAYATQRPSNGWFSATADWEIAVSDIESADEAARMTQTPRPRWNETVLTNNEDTDLGPAWSPDGTRIAFISDRSDYAEYRLYVMNSDGSAVRNLSTAIAVLGLSPAWSPVGGKIAFIAEERPSRGRPKFLHVAASDGTMDMRVAALGTTYQVEPSWSPDGERLAFMIRDKNLIPGLYTIRSDGREMKHISALLADRLSWSPAGKEILLCCAWDSGTPGLYAIDADTRGTRKISDLTSAGEAEWSLDGSRIALFTNKRLLTMDTAGEDVNVLAVTDSTEEYLYPCQDLPNILALRHSCNTVR